MTRAWEPDASPEQIRAGRAWLDWTQGELAARAGVARTAIAEYERGSRLAHPATLRAIKKAFEEGGLELLFDGTRAMGIALRLSGRDQFDGA